MTNKCAFDKIYVSLIDGISKRKVKAKVSVKKKKNGFAGFPAVMTMMIFIFVKHLPLRAFSII